MTTQIDRVQQRHGTPAFLYAVARKFADDGGGRHAALIGYYGFLSIFPILLLGVEIVSWLFAQRPDLRHRLVTEIVPVSLQDTVEKAAAAQPVSPVALAVGVTGLLLAGTGVVSSAYETLNHLAAVPYRLRAGLLSRWLRTVLVLLIVLIGALAVGALTVVVAVPPGLSGVSHAAVTIGSYGIAFAVLLLAARLLLDRPATVGALWPAAAAGAVAVTLTLELGATVLPELIRRAGPVYGSFATVAGMFTLLYVLSLALICAAEIAAVRRARLWPRAIDRGSPTAADIRALGLLAREQERLPGERISLRHVAATGPRPCAGSSSAHDARPRQDPDDVADRPCHPG